MSFEFYIFAALFLAILIFAAICVGVLLGIYVSKKLKREWEDGRKLQAGHYVRQFILPDIMRLIERHERSKDSNVEAVLWLSRGRLHIRLASPTSEAIHTMLINHKENRFEWQIGGKRIKTLPLADLHDLIAVIVQNAWVDSTIHSKDPYGHLLKTTGQAA